MDSWMPTSFSWLLTAQLLRPGGMDISGPTGDRPVKVACLGEKGRSLCHSGSPRPLVGTLEAPAALSTGCQEWGLQIPRNLEIVLLQVCRAAGLPRGPGGAGAAWAQSPRMLLFLVLL